ncbi:MAG: hypothetical protein AB7S38_28830 [Vulcanimicrobiota bacterium]
MSKKSLYIVIPVDDIDSPEVAALLDLDPNYYALLHRCHQLAKRARESGLLLYKGSKAIGPQELAMYHWKRARPELVSICASFFNHAVELGLLSCEEGVYCVENWSEYDRKWDDTTEAREMRRQRARSVSAPRPAATPMQSERPAPESVEEPSAESNTDHPLNADNHAVAAQCPPIVRRKKSPMRAGACAHAPSTDQYRSDRSNKTSTTTTTSKAPLEAKPRNEAVPERRNRPPPKRKRRNS